MMMTYVYYSLLHKEYNNRDKKARLSLCYLLCFYVAKISYLNVNYIPIIFEGIEFLPVLGAKFVWCIHSK